MIKKIILSTFFSSVFGNNFLFKLFFKNSTVVFLYHEVTNEPSEFHKKHDLNVPPELFKDQIKLIMNHFNVINAETLINGNYKKPAALITFDDGSKGNYTNAYPILEELNCPSLMFLNMGPINGEIFWPGLITYLFNCDNKFIETVINHKKNKFRKLDFLNIQPRDIEEYISSNKLKIYKNARKYYGDFMNRSDLKEMSESKFLSFGNHLYQHYNCANCSKDEIVNNYVLNHDLLKNYKNYSNLFSYPFGQETTCYNDKTNEIIYDLGAKAVFAAHPKKFFNNGKFFYRFPLTYEYINSNFLKFRLVIQKLINFFNR
tara:strand:- start:13621 stop:14571 length:951 start_codon:yes stop_codon:yes gene_type:complete